MSLPESLRALLTHLIDYAGLFPPAALPLTDVAARFDAYRASPDAWILNRLVLPAPHLAHSSPVWRITLLADADPGPVPPSVESFESKQPGSFSRPTYYEAPLDSVPAGGFAKIRTGGLTPSAIPTSESIAVFLIAAAARRVPFKATAGLHHPVRSDHALTYDADSERAMMHGFLNVFIAASFAWHGATPDTVLAILNETAAAAFQFDEADLRWRDRSLSTAEVAAARRDFAHSFGSCSFEEPISDLRQLHLLP